MPNSHRLLAIILSYAPNSKAKTKVTRMYDKMATGKQDIDKHLINLLAEGVNYGNWPWGKGE
jgi:hypothetical protein